MTKKQATRYVLVSHQLADMGIVNPDERQQLFKIERTLHNWHELECGTDAGHIERDEKTGSPFFCNERVSNMPVQDREKRALKRLAKIMAAHPSLWYYVQTDPRGCALYVGTKASMKLNPKEEPDMQDRIESNYTQGVAICY